ncbi:MAG TPA: hypothetical protein PKA95_16110, partial [Thermomicrobiales bacterium]|nr:hypothetical protein [Thermomicrobiales bacterium]
MSRWLIVLAAVLVLAAAGVWWWSQRGSDVLTAAVTRGSIDVTIQTVGTIQATGAAVVRPGASGTIDTLGVEAGGGVGEGGHRGVPRPAQFDGGVDSVESGLGQS